MVTASDVSGLVSAINTANSSSGADTICLDASTYALNAVQNNNYGPNGLPAITSEITLVGLGAGATIERAGRTPSASSASPPAAHGTYVNGYLDVWVL